MQVDEILATKYLPPKVATQSSGTALLGQLEGDVPEPAAGSFSPQNTRFARKVDM